MYLTAQVCKALHPLSLSQDPSSTKGLSTLTAMSTDAITSDLPSRVEETLRACPQ